MRQLLRGLGRAEDCLGRAETVVAMLLVTAMAVVVNLQIFARYLFNAPFIWPEEIARLTLVWLTFIGAAAAARSGTEIAVDTFVELMPPGARQVFRVGRDVVLVALFAFAATEGYALAEAVAGMPLVATELPTALLAWPVVVGSAFMALHPLLRIVRTLAVPEGAAA
jgi:TRAP-type C4-dicarboxylate transport system permease small subunit